MADLTTTAAVKTAFNITGTGFDGIIGALTTPVTKYIESYCGRVFDSATYTEFYEAAGACNKDLLLRVLPVTSVTSVHVSTDLPRVYGATELLVAGEDYIIQLAPGILVRTGGSFWTISVESIKVIYVAGFATLPEDIVQAAIEIIGTKAMKSHGKLYHISKHDHGDQLIDGIRASDIPATAKATLDLYRDRRAA